MIIYNLKAVIIDLDGTLINSLKVYDEVHKIVLERYNIITEKGFDTFGASPRELISNILNKYNINASVDDILRESEDLIISKYIDKIHFNPGAKNLLNYLKDKKLKIGVVTSNTRRLAVEVLKNLGIINLFDIIITGDDVKEPKPEPDCYIKAINLLNIVPNSVLAIEDSIYGIISAKRAGINVVGIASGVNKKSELSSAGATLVFKNLKELYDYLVKEENNYNNYNNN
ncbi:glyceraldehyde 3-phosphate phosphatase [Nanobdella aerobiophila]|uniref:Glyceraldehyde 3-phosphate phosphatase n=1 Tax=Nanobdella aerobiophila TaxID=2586965 RepID=A0A915SD28_9ARCH|nr:HAD family phosphatase [Nanobdella aerobiophila]BBL45883.1 glyceraldehyde 3-phosphate phosphatase [Nanobdella aerobiophila]